MADSILRLKVESQEYDNKLKQATNGLTRYVDECRKVGGTLEVVEKETLDYVRALGQMDTTSRTATGKLAEMRKTFIELSVQYKQLTDEEKQSQFGKALSTSLDQLKTRINDSKTQLDDVNKSLQGTESAGKESSSMLDQLAGKFTVNIDAIKLFNLGLKAAESVLRVAKDAFFASEATVDEWGRVMDSSKSLYEGFLTALNTGDISGYLSRIDSIVQAARDAYNELDRLGTMKTIQAPQMSAQQTENERMRMMIQTGRYIAPIDGRRASMQNGQMLTPEQIRRIEQQLQNGMQKMVTLVGNEVNQTGKAIDAVYNRQAQELGMSLKEFRKGTSSMAEFDKRMAGYEKYQKWRSENYYTDNWGNRRVKEGNPYEAFRNWGTFRVDGQRYNDLVRLIQQRDQQSGQAYSMQSQAYRTMNRAEGVTVRQIMGGSGGGGGKGGGKTGTEIDYAPDSIKAQQAEVSRLTKLWQSAGAAVRDDYKRQLAQAQKVLDVMNGKTDIKDISITVTADTDEAIKAVQSINGVHINPKTFTVTAESEEAVRQLKAMGGVEIADKTFVIKSNDDGVLENVKAIEGVTIEDKTFEVIAETADALVKLQTIQGVTIADKTFELKPIMPAKLVPDFKMEDPFEAFAKKRQEVQLEVKTEQIKVDENTLHTLIKDAVQNSVNGMDLQFDILGKQIAKGIDVPDSAWQSIIDQYNDLREQMGLEPITVNIQTGNLESLSNDAKVVKASFKDAASAVGNLGSALSGLDDPGAKIAGTVAQAIANIALGFSSASSKEGKGGVWYWIAATAAGLATMISTISSIHAATKYAEGGMIKGNSYSGDNILGVNNSTGELVGLNAGEIVLNRAQQGNLLSQGSGGGFNGQIVGRIEGENIVLVANRYFKRTGQGEILTWKN